MDPADAAKLLDSGKAAPMDDGPSPKQKYPNPADFKGSGFATTVNDMLDEVDSAPPGAKISKPASKFMVGECAAATAAHYSNGADLQIHPGILLAFGLTAYGTAVAIHAFTNRPPLQGGQNRFGDL